MKIPKHVYIWALSALSLCFICGCGSEPTTSDQWNSPSSGAVLSEASVQGQAQGSSADTTPTFTPTPTLTPTPTVTPTPTPTPTPTVTPTPTPKVSTITCSFAGDVTLGSDLINQNKIRNFYVVYDRVKDDSYFLKNVQPYFSTDDLTLVNFEGTLSARGYRMDKTYAFRGDPSYVNILLEGSVEAVSLANNHSLDYGPDSYEDTIATMEEAGILYAKGDMISYTEINGTKVAMISIDAMPGNEASAKNMVEKTVPKAVESGALLILISFHGGTEGSTVTNSTQTSLSHLAIDLGATTVLWHHPHRLQGIEKYNDHYIVYSLANFCFGGNTNPGDKDTMIVQQTFTFIDDELQLNDDFRVIPCSVSSVVEPNNYQPTPQTGSEAERIMERINSYSKTFHMHFKESSEGVYIPDFEN